jgi:radical SAM protein with 4Fe4S-binding SPASM domain
VDDGLVEYDDFIRQGTIPGWSNIPVPKPSMGMEFYQLERERCLATDPRKRENYERFLSSRRTAEVDYMPVRLDIENVSRCNLRCNMCVVSDWKKGQRAQDLSFDDFKTLIDEQYGLVEIKIQGLGEPTMPGDPFFQMIRYARDSHIWVRTTTNATRLHLQDIHRKLIDSGIPEIQISVDGATKDVYESIRIGSVFERVKENCRMINAYAQSQDIRSTKMWFLVQKLNQHECLQAVDLAAELGFRDLAYSWSLISWGDPKWRQTNDELEVSAEERGDYEMAHRIIERAAQLGIRVGFWVSDIKYDTRSIDTLCPWPFERSLVTSDNRVVPCCTIGNPDSFEIGRGTGKSLSELWFSDEYRQFRQTHLDGKIPEVCRKCYVR